jgi:hypothetical protein
MITRFLRAVFPLISSVILVSPASANRGGLCQPSVATTSTYYTPSAKVVCNSTKPCEEFKEMVSVQGSGTLSKGTIYTSTGKTVDIGDCDTTKGKGNTCLIPYISVAADLRYHELGDIIEMPALKGKVITLPNGKKFKHPGYFIVDDRGAKSYIKGENRFDVYTGPHDLDDPKNAFGQDAPAELRMVDKTECGPHKKFIAIKPGDPQYRKSQIAINQSLHAAGEEPVFAVNMPSSSGGSSQSYGVH